MHLAMIHDQSLTPSTTPFSISRLAARSERGPRMRRTPARSGFVSRGQEREYTRSQATVFSKACHRDLEGSLLDPLPRV